MNKEELREKYKQVRKNIKNKEKLSGLIAQKVIASSEYMNAKVICIYKNLKDEVDTSEIINDALKRGKIVGIPITYKTHMDFYKISSIEEIKNINSFGAGEPEQNKQNLINPQIIDLVIIPGICFDVSNNRLGFGKGYYDKYLNNKELSALKIGICFKKQVMENELIDVDIYDVKMDKLVYN